LDQTKELCFEHASQYKDFESVYAKILMRFQQWELFDDREVTLATMAIKTLAGSGQVVSMIQERHLMKLIMIYDTSDMPVDVRWAVVESFHLIAKNIGLRKVFMRPQVLHVLLRHSLVLTNEKELTERTRKIKEETVKLLCLICTVKTNRFYIPGETKMVERLRKEAFDKGIFATLTYLYHHLHGEALSEIRTHIKEKCLNLIELNDLFYHVTVIEQLTEILKQNPNACS
jgi:hypothetical protein